MSCKHGFLCTSLRGVADKSSARPWRKQAKANKLGIYSTYSTRSSIHFLAHYSAFVWHTSFQPLWQGNTCNSAHEQTPLSNDIIDSVLRHREVVRAKDFSAPPRMLTLDVKKNSILRFHSHNISVTTNYRNSEHKSHLNRDKYLPGQRYSYCLHCSSMPNNGTKTELVMGTLHFKFYHKTRYSIVGSISRVNQIKQYSPNT